MIGAIQKIAGFLPLNDWLWIGLAVSLIGYHEFALHSAVSEARTEEAAKWKDSIAKANAEAAADHKTQQDKIDELAASAQPELARKLAQQQRDINTLVAAASKPPKVLQGQCTVPPDQVAAYNGIGK